MEKTRKMKKTQKKKNTDQLNQMYACYSDHLPVQLLLSERQMHFQIQYNTSFGEFLVVVGSIESFGSWNPKNAVKMNWNPGNVWTWHTFFER